MASPDPELKDGFALPAWIKTKPTRDFDQFAGSPPGPDDSFFYIRYPKTDALFAKKQAEQDPTKILSDQTKEFATSAFNVAKDKDWSKHTKPCQDVMHGIAQINTNAAVHSASLKPKSAGTDDGFKGEGAACGSSVVKMANEMVSSGRSPRGFTVAAPIDDVADEAPNYKLMQRRGSKSMPTTPIQSPTSSPTGRRKKYANRYFTSPFEPSDDGSNRSWLTMALLGFKRDLTASTSTLAEEDAIEARLQGDTLAQSVEYLGPAPRGKEQKANSIETTTQQPKLTKPASTFRPKPSELREMNFWSPTSM